MSTGAGRCGLPSGSAASAWPGRSSSGSSKRRERGATNWRRRHTGAGSTLRGLFVFNRSFWLLAALCFAFYGCIFPFQTFGQKFLIEARGATPRAASLLVGMEPLFSLLFMPLFGHLVDRYGNRSLFMMLGSLLLVPVFPMLA